MITTATKAFEIVNRIFEANYPGLAITSINIPEPLSPTWIIKLTFSCNGSKFGASAELDAISDLVKAVEVVPSSELRVTSNQLLEAINIDRLAELARDAGLSEKELAEKRQLLSAWVQGKLEAKGLTITPDALDGICNLIVSLMEGVAESLTE